MNYSEFEYTITNKIFRMALIEPSEYSGRRSIIIDDWSHVVYMITINREETDIRISFPEYQTVKHSYEDAIICIMQYLDNIRKSKTNITHYKLEVNLNPQDDNEYPGDRFMASIFAFDDCELEWNLVENCDWAPDITTAIANGLEWYLQNVD